VIDLGWLLDMLWIGYTLGSGEWRSLWGVNVCGCGMFLFVSMLPCLSLACVAGRFFGVLHSTCLLNEIVERPQFGGHPGNRPTSTKYSAAVL
jgi:hypothetical protein